MQHTHTPPFPRLVAGWSLEEQNNRVVVFKCVSALLIINLSGGHFVGIKRFIIVPGEQRIFPLY